MLGNQLIISCLTPAPKPEFNQKREKEHHNPLAIRILQCPPPNVLDIVNREGEKSRNNSARPFLGPRLLY